MLARHPRVLLKAGPLAYRDLGNKRTVGRSGPSKAHRIIDDFAGGGTLADIAAWWSASKQAASSYELT
jgi:hypothetical protein